MNDVTQSLYAIPGKWLHELLALCGPEDHELRERIRAALAAAPQAPAPVDMPATTLDQDYEAFAQSLVKKYGFANWQCKEAFEAGATLAAPQAPAAPCGDERTAFEAWIKKDGGDLSTFGSGQNRHYNNSAVNNAWTGWSSRAAMAAPAEPASKRIGQIVNPASEQSQDMGTVVVAEIMSNGYNGQVLWKGTVPPVGTLLYAAPQAAPAAPAAVPDEREASIRYDVLHEFATKHRVDYNELCTTARAALAATPAAAPVVPKWIDDPHDIEQGQMLNPEWVKAQKAAAAPVVLPEPRWHNPSPHDAAHFPYYTPDDVRALLAQANAAGAQAVPDFCHVASLKLKSLQERGYAITGYAIEKAVDGAQPERGFISNGGFVGWCFHGERCGFINPI